ncbi:hypothetical protein Pelo_7447 [Pelomyxa schiedti]|nr:hypothetical protein Pelo_7447 [Pelomyxa schiedti]
MAAANEGEQNFFVEYLRNSEAFQPSKLVELSQTFYAYVFSTSQKVAAKVSCWWKSLSDAEKQEILVTGLTTVITIASSFSEVTTPQLRAELLNEKNASSTLSRIGLRVPSENATTEEMRAFEEAFRKAFSLHELDGLSKEDMLKLQKLFDLCKTHCNQQMLHEVINLLSRVFTHLVPILIAVVGVTVLYEAISEFLRIALAKSPDLYDEAKAIIRGKGLLLCRENESIIQAIRHADWERYRLLRTVTMNTCNAIAESLTQFLEKIRLMIELVNKKTADRKAALKITATLSAVFLATSLVLTCGCNPPAWALVLAWGGTAGCGAACVTNAASYCLLSSMQTDLNRLKVATKEVRAVAQQESNLLQQLGEEDSHLLLNAMIQLTARARAVTDALRH